ncbi:MAG: methyltransferase domain-containing protein [Mobilicoccus sp.]|nr:methyltransferase domain-containing protein [Mobilicoccus sp.]
MNHDWNPGSYARFSGERSRPFVDLLARVGEIDPETVVDLGCGDGSMTVALAERWPQARVIGIEPSTQMLAAARERDPGGVEWREGTAQEWDAADDGPIDLLITNAVLQWVPGHENLLPSWAEALAPGGVLALQVPGNMGAPSHALMREVAEAHPRAEELTPALDRARASLEPLDYVRLLHAAGLEVDAWETTYLHLLPTGEEHPVLSWIRSTGLRPVEQVLTEAEFADFTRDYEDRLREAYPEEDFGVALPFRRIFVVARRPA